MRKKAIDINNVSEEKKQFLSESPKLAATRKGVYCGNLIEPLPTFARAECETVYSSENNSYIVLGRDRPRSRNSGYGGKGDTQSSMIDLVVGRMADSPQDGVIADPNFSTDSARIYISQKTDVDKNFGLAPGSGQSRAKSAIGL